MANSSLRTEYGLQVIGDSLLAGNVTVQNTSALIANTIYPVSNAALLGNTTARWVITANSGDFSNSITVSANLTVNTIFFATSNSTVNKITINATANALSSVGVNGAVTVSNTVTGYGNVYFGNSTVGHLIVNTDGGRVGIGNNAGNTSVKLVVQGNTQVFSGDLVVNEGGIQTNFVQINAAGGLRLADGVNITLQGALVGDMLPAFATGTANATTTVGSNTVTIVGGTGTAGLVTGYYVVNSSIFAANTKIASVTNSTSFTTTIAATADATAQPFVYYSNYVDGAIATYNVGSPTDYNKRWNLYVKNGRVDNTFIVSEAVTLGNSSFTGTHLITGNTKFGNSTANIVFVDSVNQRLGINTGSPDSPLQVAGTAKVTDLTVTANSASNNSTVSKILAVDTNKLYVSGNVGISTSSPDATLAVNGTANVSGNTYIGGILTAGANVVVGNSTVNSSLRTTGEIFASNSFNLPVGTIKAGNVAITAVNTPTLVDSFANSTALAAKYLIRYQSDASPTTVHGATELIVINNGSSEVLYTEYGTLYNANVLFNVTASQNSSTKACEVYASSNTSGIRVAFVRTAIR